jgi:hypothetical protein
MPVAEGGLTDPGHRVEATRRVAGLMAPFGRVMNVLDLIKATIACGLSAFLIYSFPVVGQILIIGVLSLLWLSYAHRTLARMLRR